MRLGNYEIIAALGAGGMGEVYRARDTRLGRDVAVKVLPADVTNQPDRLTRFEREARTVARLNHPNIVTLHSIENVEGVRFLTMELVEGESLDRLVTSGGLAIARVIDFGVAIADALTAAHEQGVVHRDLKPANVMVTREGRVKVLDFGLAKHQVAEHALESTQARTMTTPPSIMGQIVGTVPYMAPEQLRGETVDRRSDLFALGVLLYELAAGHRPFTGKTHADVSSSILRDSPEPIDRPDVPGEFERIIVRCLEKDPVRRFQTAPEVLNELRELGRALEHGPLPARRPTALGTASIAVLPFVNRGPSRDDEYFSDGLTDELLTVLARIRGLRVAARTSAFHFKGKDTTLAEVGKALNVATVLEGSVRKAGNRVRIGVQLVKVSDGYHLWSETYDRTLDDIFAVQDDIARSVVKELRTALLGEEVDSRVSGETRAEVAKAARGRTTNAEAHRLYLQARYLLDQYTEDSTTRAIADLNHALELDPRYALGWATLGQAYDQEASKGWTAPEQRVPLARAAVERALEIDPNLADAHAQAGEISMTWDWDWRAARRSFRRSLELEPHNAYALRWAGTMALYECDYEDAVRHLRAAIDQDPLSSSAYHNLGVTCHAAGDLEAAATACRRSLDLTSRRAATRTMLALVLLDQGRPDEALAELAQEPSEIFRLFGLAIVHHSAGHSEEADAALAEFVTRHADDGPRQIAQIYAHRGERDRAFEWLERAYELRDPGVIEVKPNPTLRSLHDDPRWTAFLKKMNLGD